MNAAGNQLSLLFLSDLSGGDRPLSLDTETGRPKTTRSRAKLFLPYWGKQLCGISRVKLTSGPITQECALNTISNTQNYVWPCQPRWPQRVPWVPGRC